MQLRSNRLVYSIPLIGRIVRRLNAGFARDDFVSKSLLAIDAGAVILDAGCGSQRYREECSHLSYKSQDFSAYTLDEAPSFGADSRKSAYHYGSIDYVCDIVEIPEEDAFFDAILCTEVLEHIPYPEKAIAEFARLLRPGGVLVLTVPASCLRHFDPYYFYSGFSDRWINKVLNDRGFDVRVVEPVGDYFGWIAAELARTASRNSIFSKILIAPALAYFLLRKKTHASVSTLCMGYHVVANKRIEVVN